MAGTTSVTAEPGGRTIVMTRVFDAPRMLVFRAYTDPEAIARWWGPQRYTTTVDEMDVRPGGAWRYVQHDADGNEHAFRGEYREVLPPERLVYTFEYEGMPGHVAVESATFEVRDGKTLLTVETVFDSVEDRDGMLQSGAEDGARETWDRLAEYLDTLPRRDIKLSEDGELVVTRIFDAPPQLVWNAWTSPEHVMRWWGPKSFTAPAAQIDLRVGGKYLLCMRSPDGQDSWSTGVYQEIVPFERLVFTDSFADEHGNVVPPSRYGMGDDFPEEFTVIVTFEDLGDRTRMTLRHRGMPGGTSPEMAGAGWSESFDKLDEVLRTA